MKRFTRRLCCGLMAGMCVLSLAACGDDKQAAANLPDDTVVMTVNGADVTLAEYRDYALYTKSMAEQYYGSLGLDTSSLWDSEDVAEELLNMTDDLIIENHAVYAQQEALGLTLTDEDEAYLVADKQDMIDQMGGEEAFAEWLSQNAMQEAIFDRISRDGLCSEKVREYYFGVGGTLVTDEAALRQTFDDTYFKAKHILISTVDDSQQPLPEDELAEKKALLQQVQDKLAAGEDFDTLMQEYSEDPGLATSPDGYVFTEGQMIDAFYEGTKALAFNEISQPVESEFGYHIILRLEPTEDDYLAVRDTLAETAAGKTFSDLLDEWAEEMDVTYPEAHDELTLATLTA